MSILEIKNVDFAYGDKPVLHQINVALEAGQYYALLGPNGTGKSTLFALICQLLQPSPQSVFIKGKDVTQKPHIAMRDIGIVFQQSTLDLDLTVEQNLRYHASLHGLNKPQAQLAIHKELARLSLTDKLNTKVRALNGGHRRRVEIARALLHKPSLLLLDEASVGLDLPSRESINQHIRRLCEDEGVTVLSSTHLIDEIRRQDHLLVMLGGKLVLDAPCEDAMRTYALSSVPALYRLLTQQQAAA